MLELGWGTPSLRRPVRLGLLGSRPNQFTLLGQGIVAAAAAGVGRHRAAVPAARLRRLRRVRSVAHRVRRQAASTRASASISITGQFAFRARFGDQPTFLHQRRRLPPALQGHAGRHAAAVRPRRRELRHRHHRHLARRLLRDHLGHRAGRRRSARSGPTSASPASRAASASTRSATCEPKFYFEVDLHAYLAVDVFGIDFRARSTSTACSAGPGRWHIAGHATRAHAVAAARLLARTSTSTGASDLDTPEVTVNVAAELCKPRSRRSSNWTAQLPGRRRGYVTLAKIAAGTDVLAHPLRHAHLPAEARCRSS